MKKIDYIEKSDIFLSSLKKIGDIENYGIPFLSLFCDSISSKLYLSIRGEQEENIVRWVFVEASRTNILAYLEEQIDLKSVILETINKACYYVDLEGGNQMITYKLYSFPKEYLPIEDELFDIDGCKNYYTIMKFLSNTNLCCI